MHMHSYLLVQWPCWLDSWWRYQPRWACGSVCWGLPCQWSPLASARPPSLGYRWTYPTPWWGCWSLCWQGWSLNFGASVKKEKKENGGILGWTKITSERIQLNKVNFQENQGHDGDHNLLEQHHPPGCLFSRGHFSRFHLVNKLMLHFKDI